MAGFACSVEEDRGRHAVDRRGDAAHALTEGRVRSARAVEEEPRLVAGSAFSVKAHRRVTDRGDPAHADLDSCADGVGAGRTVALRRALAAVRDPV